MYMLIKVDFEFKSYLKTLNKVISQKEYPLSRRKKIHIKLNGANAVYPWFESRCCG